MEASLAVDLVVVLHLDTEFHPARNCRRVRFRHPLRAPIEIGSKNRKPAKLAMPTLAPRPGPTGLFLIVNSVIRRLGVIHLRSMVASFRGCPPIVLRQQTHLIVETQSSGAYRFHNQLE